MLTACVYKSALIHNGNINTFAQEKRNLKNQSKERMKKIKKKNNATVCFSFTLFNLICV